MKRRNRTNSLLESKRIDIAETVGMKRVIEKVLISFYGSTARVHTGKIDKDFNG